MKASSKPPEATERSSLLTTPRFALSERSTFFSGLMDGVSMGLMGESPLGRGMQRYGLTLSQN